MREILYIAPYRQKDEWGKNSKALLNLLLEQEIDLIIRPVWFNNDNNYNEQSEIIEEYEIKKIKNNDIIIQYGLPEYLNYNGNFNENVAITHVDCNFRNIGWVDHLNLFDKVIVFSEYEKQLLLDSGLSTKIFNFKLPPFYIENNNLIELNLEHLKNHFTFYTVCSKDKRSGLKELLISYLSSFDTLDSVILIILHNEKDGVLEQQIEEIKSSLNKYAIDDYYPNIALISTTEDGIINYLHNNADCFIDTSYNTKVPYNVINALYNQRLTIMPDTYNIIEKYPLYINTNNEIITYSNPPIHGLYSGEYNWKIPNTIDLQNKLKSVFYNTNDIIEIAKQKIIKFRSSLIHNAQQSIKEFLCI